MRIFNAKVYNTENRRFYTGSVEYDNGVITKTDISRIRKSEEDIDADNAYLIPGFIDVHSHGRAGGDFMTGDLKTVEKSLDAYLKHGVTTVFPCVMTADYIDLKAAIVKLKSAETRINVDGVHVEGPYISPKMPGCHDISKLRELNPEEAEELTELIKPLKAHFTVAPELDKAGFIKTLVKHGATVGIGHTDCSYAQAVEAVKDGCASFTHTFNAMRGLKHREPGTVGAALSGVAYAEFIVDLIHVCPEVIKMAYKLLGADKFVIVSDSIAASDMPDGRYALAGTPVNVVGGKVLTDGGVIAGSSANIFDELKNLMSVTGMPLEKVLPVSTENPAKQVGIFDKTGSIDAGKRADILLLKDGENGLDIKKVIVKGKVVI